MTLPNKNFCVMPFIALYQQPTGVVKQCCKNHIEVGNTQNNSLETIWNSQQSTERRIQFLKGERPASCNECWLIEDQDPTAESFRHLMNRRNGSEIPRVVEQTNPITGELPFSPVKVELGLSNLCNLACKMCWPSISSTLSSKWEAVAHIIPVDSIGYRKSFNSVDDVISSLAKTTTIKELMLTGGEPLMEPATVDLLQQLTPTDDLVIMVMTNLSELQHGKVDVLTELLRFKKISLIISSEGLPKVHEYIRTGSSFDKIESNLEKVREILGDRLIDVAVNVTVGALNALSWADGLKEIQSRFKPNRITVGAIQNSYLSAKILPTKLKELAIKRVTETLDNEYLVDTFVAIVNEPIDEDDRKKNFRQFKDFVSAWDKENNEDVLDIVPELREYFFPDSFCPMPFINFTMTPDAEARTCCKNYTNLGNTKTESIPIIWNSQGYKDIRKSFMNKRMPESCYECIDQEEFDGHSHRMMYLERYADIIPQIKCEPDGTMNTGFRTIEVLLSNLCNLSCRMCYPKISSSVNADWHRAKLDTIAMWPLVDKKQSSLVDPEAFMRDLKDNSENIVELTLSGGEPLIDPKVIDTVRNLASFKKIPYLKVVTNLSTDPQLETLVEISQYTDQLEIKLSIDGYPALNDYIRQGIITDNYVRRVLRAKELLPNAIVAVNIAFSIYNILRPIQTIEWIYETINPKYITTSFSSHITRPQLLPVSFLTKTLYDVDKKRETVIDEGRKIAYSNVASALKQVWSNDWYEDVKYIDALTKSMEYIRRQDELHRTDISKIVPELSEIMADPLGFMGQATTEHLESIKSKLDSVSPTMCAAKWLQSTIALQVGMTHSCHHPPQHKIPIESIRKLGGINSTPQKLFERSELRSGIQTKGCEQCWNAENAGAKFSDRHYKSGADWALQSMDKVLKGGNANPAYLEVSFDNNCNLKCSYCGPEFSSSWMGELKKFGSYKLKSHEHHSLAYLEKVGRLPFKHDEENPYTEAFWDWFTEIASDLKVFRITGGEPLMSRHMWTVLEWFCSHPNPNIELAINTNMMAKEEFVDRLIEYANRLRGKVKKFTVYTSVDGTGVEAEYIRNGLDYEVFKNNIHRYLSNTPYEHQICFMTTLNIMSYSTIHLHLDWILKLRKQYDPMKYFNRTLISLNPIRWPEFLQIENLPTNLKEEMVNNLTPFLNRKKQVEEYVFFNDSEIDAISRIIKVMMSKEPIPERQEDLITFVIEHDVRRGTDFSQIFPKLNLNIKG